MSERSYRYRAGSVVIASELPLPLPEEPNGAPARVELARGTRSGGALLRIESAGVGEAWWEGAGGGAPVRLRLDAGASAQGVQSFVQGLVVPTALQLGGAFFVHAASAVIGGAIVAVVGPSGVGKSSLAGALARAGYRLFGDDGLALDVAGEVRPLVGSAPLRLGDDTVRALGLDPADFTRCPTSGKCWIPDAALGAPSTSNAGGPLAAVYFLERGSTARVTAMSQTDAVLALLRSEFHPDPGGRALSDEPRRLEAATRVARAAPMRRLEAPADLARLGDLVDAIVCDLGDVADE